MNSRLSCIQNWPALAHAAKYCVTTMAQRRGVSLRHLERFFKETMGNCPCEWLNEQRQLRALELIRDGSTVKEAADELGYKQRSHFSREFKKFHGFAPSQRALMI